MNGKFKCLVIDDDPIAASIYRAVLASRSGVDVVLAPSGGVARRLFLEAGGQLDLILCDLSMPEGDGIDVIEFLARMEHRGAVALVSGQPGKVMRSAEKHAHDLGLNLLGAFGKPVHPHDLLRLVDDLRDQACAADVFDMTSLVTDADVAHAFDAGLIDALFQPRVNLRTAEVVGVEALARLRHEKCGLLGPGAFFPAVRRLGRATELFTTMLLNSLVEVSRWSVVPPDFTVSVNLTIGDLGEHRLSELVEHALRTVGADPSLLVLDVTGARALFASGQARRELTRLRLMGVSVAMDDLGSGSFPLAQLLDYPFNELKISPLLTKRAPISPSAAACVRSSAKFASVNGMRVVGMGIETPEQADCLRKADIQIGQGYWFGRPMPGSGMAPVLARSAQEATDRWRRDLQPALVGGTS